MLLLVLQRRLWLLIASFLGRFICHVGVCVAAKVSEARLW
jgi:hypothetical protein